MHVHIAISGASPEPITKAFNTISGIDKVYILYSKKYQDTAKKLESFIEEGMAEPNLVMITGFDFQEIVDRIYDIYEKESGKDVKFSINITGGTNLMAAAACSTAFFIGATIYYVQWDPELPVSKQLVEIPAPKTHNVNGLGEMTRKILGYISEEDRKGKAVTNSSISSRFDSTKQATAYHIRRLEHEKLITVERGLEMNGIMDNRQSRIVLTRQGRMISNWMIL